MNSSKQTSPNRNNSLPLGRVSTKPPRRAFLRKCPAFLLGGFLATAPLLAPATAHAAETPFGRREAAPSKAQAAHSPKAGTSPNIPKADAWEELDKLRNDHAAALKIALTSINKKDIETLQNLRKNHLDNRDTDEFFVAKVTAAIAAVEGSSTIVAEKPDAQSKLYRWENSLYQIKLARDKTFAYHDKRIYDADAKRWEAIRKKALATNDFKLLGELRVEAALRIVSQELNRVTLKDLAGEWGPEENPGPTFYITGDGLLGGMGWAAGGSNYASLGNGLFRFNNTHYRLMALNKLIETDGGNKGTIHTKKGVPKSSKKRK